jgi:hypothetical protein
MSRYYNVLVWQTTRLDHQSQLVLQLTNFKFWSYSTKNGHSLKNEAQLG